MSRSVGVYAFEPGTPEVPLASATGLFVARLVGALKETGGLDVRLRWLRPAPGVARGRAGRAVAGLRWAGREARRVLADTSRELVFIYPKLPIMGHSDRAPFLGLTHRTFQAVALKSAVLRQTLNVVVEDLPIEMAEGRAQGGGPPPRVDARRIRRIERTLFRCADRIVAPPGFARLIRERYDVDESRFRLFHRNIYPAEVPEEPPEGLDFESGAVDFFYSGSVHVSVAPNFREVLRSIRNAPGVRLHVCGPDGDAVDEWLRELDVPNARHYGRLPLPAHDWLARRCDIGLILYPTDNPYNHLTPTMKYSAYLANGLAVLSTDLDAVSANLERDGVGRALPIKELSVEMLRWATRPVLWREYRDRAEALAPEVRSGEAMRGWIEELG